MVDAAVVVVVFVISIVVSALVAFRNRNKFLASKGRFDWLPLICVVASASVVFISLMAYSAYAGFLYLFFYAPIIIPTCLVLLIAAAIRRRRRQFTSILLTLVAFLGASWALDNNEGTIRPSIRWLLWSRSFKAEVLAQPAPAHGELRHMEWEATGFAGVANVNIYLVFDPTDSLAAAAKSHAPGKFSGLPCEVLRVLRLESHWYSVTFYTDEWWGQRNGLNCE
jgi:hypothetical protein